MKNADVLMIAAGAGLLALLLSRDDSDGYEVEIPMGALPPSESPSDYGDYGDFSSPDESETFDMLDLFTATDEQKLYAFLYMLRFTEHSAADAASGDAYRTFYGGSRFVDMSDHPVLTGEKTGVRLSDQMCKNAGLGPGCVSTAAGAYQLIKPTWNRVRAAGSWGPRLEDFSNVSQDEAARRILLDARVLPMIYAGDVERAIYKAAPIWASLPGNTYRQGAKNINFALARYQDGLTEASEILL